MMCSTDNFLVKDYKIKKELFRQDLMIFKKCISVFRSLFSE